MGLFGGGKSKSKSSTTTTQTDNRIVAEGSTVAGIGATINNAGADRIAELNADFLGAVAESQNDALKTIANYGTDGFVGLTGAFERSGSNITKSLDGLLQTSERITGKLLDSATAQSDGARLIAQAAISSYQPPDAKQGETLQRLGYAAAAIVAGVILLRK